MLMVNAVHVGVCSTMMGGKVAQWFKRPIDVRRSEIDPHELVTVFFSHKNISTLI